jgi:hypothetical protein
MNAQQEAYQAVEKRGYLDPEKWTKDQLIVRQILKLAEELGEAGMCAICGRFFRGAGELCAPCLDKAEAGFWEQEMAEDEREIAAEEGE